MNFLSIYTKGQGQEVVGGVLVIKSEVIWYAYKNDVQILKSVIFYETFKKIKVFMNCNFQMFIQKCIRIYNLKFFAFST